MWNVLNRGSLHLKQIFFSLVEIQFRTRCTEIFSESHESCQTDLFYNVDLSYHIEVHLIREMWTYKMAKYALSFWQNMLCLLYLKSLFWKIISFFLSLHDWNVKFPDNSLTFWQNFSFPWHNMKFTDNSLTLKKIKIPRHFPDAHEPCSSKNPLSTCEVFQKGLYGMFLFLSNSVLWVGYGIWLNQFLVIALLHYF